MIGMATGGRSPVACVDDRHFLHRFLNRSHNIHIPRATTNVTRDSLTDFVFIGGRIIVQQLQNAQNHPWCAEPALKAVMPDERFLHRMQSSSIDNAFNCKYRRAVYVYSESAAGFGCSAI